MVCESKQPPPSLDKALPHRRLGTFGPHVCGGQARAGRLSSMSLVPVRLPEWVERGEPMPQPFTVHRAPW